MKSKRRSRWVPLLVLVVGATAAVVAATRPWAQWSRAEAAAQAPVALAEPVVDVEIATARQRLMRDEISAVGTLRAAESVMLRPEIAGRIDRIHFRDGQAVRAGDLLVSLDATVIGAEVEQARAELDLARSNVRRTRELANQRFVSARSLDEAESSMRVLEAKLKLAQARLGKTQIRAPFDGVLGLRQVSVGDYVEAGTDLVRIEDLSSMEVDLRLPERFLGEIDQGQLILLTLDAYPQASLKARLVAIDAQVDAGGRALLVRGRLESTDTKLRTGMFARARLVTGESPDAVVIPEEALVVGADESHVFVVEGDRARRVVVRTGRRTAGVIEIVSGLSPGDRVIVAGHLKLRGESPRVNAVVPAPAPAASAR
jgi:membrane fusion protein (multidrug efflux system)